MSMKEIIKLCPPDQEARPTGDDKGQEKGAHCHFCRKPVCRRDLNQHHVIPKSEGGTETAPAHRKCHVKHHSRQNDYQRWGRMGGLKTASLMIWIFNLKRGRRPADPLRWIPFGY